MPDDGYRQRFFVVLYANGWCFQSEWLFSCCFFQFGGNTVHFNCLFISIGTRNDSYA